MDKFTKTVTSINTLNNLNEAKKQVSDVKKSNLTEEEKTKALKSHNKMIKLTVLIVVILTIIMAVLMIVGFSISGKAGVIISIIALIAMPTILITYAIIAKKKLFSDWTSAYEKVDNGFDGLEKPEIDKLKPNYKEELIIKKYKKKSLVSGLIFLLTIAIEFAIIVSLDIAIYSYITIIITVIITVIWYIFENTYQVEIQRIKSGYYKKSFGFICEKCKSEVKINFEDLEKYSSLPRNEHGIRVMNCHKCGNPVPLYNFDTVLGSYKKYLEQLK